jgi:Flp pilus assembly protein TadG
MTLPLLMMVLIGLWDVGRAVQVKQVLMGAVREGARQASTGRLTNSEVQQVVRCYIQNAGLPIGNLVVTVANTTSGKDAAAADQFDRISVTATIPFSDVRLVSVSLINGPSALVASQSTWHSLKDRPYPDPVDPPIE